MRFVRRLDLDKVQKEYLEKQQTKIDKQPLGFSTKDFWENRRNTQKVKSILNVLCTMAGSRERCMYCLDSHGTDIEHFYPKSRKPFSKMFEWGNWLLCCTNCGRIKLDQFPLNIQDEPLLIDPSTENPWDYIDFDPRTGNLTARFDLASNAKSVKGKSTVDTLRLDVREALSEGYRKTWKHLVNKVKKFLEYEYNQEEFITKLLATDDEHHLLGWCLHGSGETGSPFAELKRDHPSIWNTLCNHPEIPIPTHSV